MVGPAIVMEDLVASALSLLDQPGRRFLAIAGAPGSGKSTTAETLLETLDRAAPGMAAILPMDGFHYDDAILHERGRRPWKGAPDTCLLYTSPSPRDRTRPRMPSSA